MTDTHNEHDDIDEIEYDEDAGAAQLQKLRAKLKACEQEKRDNLDGWKRTQADLVNARTKHAQALTDARTRATEDVLVDVITALDSFDVAFRGDAWESVDANWRTGIEYIYTQLQSALERHGVAAYGAEGEPFDPQLHEAVGQQPTDDDATDTIVRVERRGYKSASRILRPAQVVVSA